jgi:hypothetical protein
LYRFFAGGPRLKAIVAGVSAGFVDDAPHHHVIGITEGPGPIPCARFNARTRREILKTLEPLRRAREAFEEVPNSERKSARWTEPKTVAEVAFTESPATACCATRASRVCGPTSCRATCTSKFRGRRRSPGRSRRQSRGGEDRGPDSQPFMPASLYSADQAAFCRAAVRDGMTSMRSKLSASARQKILALAQELARNAARADHAATAAAAERVGQNAAQSERSPAPKTPKRA